MAHLSTKDALRLCRDTEDIQTILSLTEHENAAVRQRALKEICPCRVKDDIDLFWTRVLQMIDDPADNVREQVRTSEYFIDVIQIYIRTSSRFCTHFATVHLIIWKCKC
jgi:hypothetical protein